MSQYDSVAEQYARLVAPKYAAIARLVADRARPAPDASVVELAAGTGALTRLVAPRVVELGGYVALDISAPMLARARPTLDPRVRLLVADVAAVPLPDAVADVVISSLGPVQDSAAALAEAFRLLSPGGRLVFAMWGADYLERRLLAAARRRIDAAEYPRSDVAGAQQRVTAAGFAKLRSTTVRLPVVHESIAAYLAYRLAFGAAPSIPPGRLSDALDAIAAEAAAYQDADGRVCLDWQLVVVAATRPALPVRHDRRATAQLAVTRG